MRATLVAINARYVHTNLAVRILHAAVEASGAEVAHAVLELHINQPFEQQLRAVWDTAPDVVCFSAYIWNVENVYRLARTLKRAMPGLRIALGGPEVSFDGAALLAKHPYIDAVLAGEGERSYPALLEAWDGHKLPAEMPGIHLRDQLTPGNPAMPIPPETWPNPYADIPGFDPHRIWYAETARGCPFRCSFCLSAGETVRALPAELAIKRLKGMAARGARLVKLVDRTFNFDADRAIAIWQALMDMDADCVFHFEIEARLLDASSLALLARVPKGRFQFEIGVQTTTRTTLRAIRRSGDFEAVAGPVRALREGENIPLHLDLIAGLPGETFASFATAFDAVYALRPHRLQLGFLKVLPGSALRRDADALGVVYAPDPPYAVLRTPHLSFKELETLRDVEKALDWYGNSGRHAAAMGLLMEGEGASPFAIYHGLACALRAAGMFDADRSARHRAEALEALAPKLFGIDPQALAGAMRADERHEVGYKRYKGRQY